MYVTRTEVATPGGRTAGAIDAKDYGSKDVHMITNCGVGASGPSAIYIRPFCIDTAVFKGDEALSDGEMPIRKANTPVEFANDLKEQLEKIAPARILKDTETPRTGWLVVGHFQLVDGGSPLGRFFSVVWASVGPSWHFMSGSPMSIEPQSFMNSTWPAAVVSKADMERSGPAGSVGRHTSIS